MKSLKQNPNGFITMIIVLVVALVVVITAAYLRVKNA